VTTQQYMNIYSLASTCNHTLSHNGCLLSATGSVPNSGANPQLWYNYTTKYKKVMWVVSMRSKVQAILCFLVSGDPWWVLLHHSIVLRLFFNQQVWYRALSLCYVRIQSSGIILINRLPLCQILFLSRHSLLH